MRECKSYLIIQSYAQQLCGISVYRFPELFVTFPYISSRTPELPNGIYCRGLAYYPLKIGFFGFYGRLYLHTGGNLCEKPGSSLFIMFVVTCSIVKRMRPL